jgi:hypothetical protein
MGERLFSIIKKEVLETLKEAKFLVDGWRKEFNRFRPYSSLGYRPPAPEAPRLENSLRGWYIDWGGSDMFNSGTRQLTIRYQALFLA